MTVEDVDLVLVKPCVCSRFREYRATYCLVLNGTPLVGISDPELVVIRKIMEYPARAKKMAGRIGYVFSNSALRSLRINDALKVQVILIKREQKGSFLGRRQWPRQHALEVTSLFRRLC